MIRSVFIFSFQRWKLQLSILFLSKVIQKFPLALVLLHISQQNSSYRNFIVMISPEEWWNITEKYSAILTIIQNEKNIYLSFVHGDKVLLPLILDCPNKGTSPGDIRRLNSYCVYRKVSRTWKSVLLWEMITVEIIWILLCVYMLQSMMVFKLLHVWTIDYL